MSIFQEHFKNRYTPYLKALITLYVSSTLPILGQITKSLLLL